MNKFGASGGDPFGLDVETEAGVLRYTLLLAHDIEEKTAAITLEELSLDDKPAYRFASREVQLFGEDAGQAKGPFPFSPQRSFLAAFDPKIPLWPIARFKGSFAGAGACASTRFRSARQPPLRTTASTTTQ